MTEKKNDGSNFIEQVNAVKQKQVDYEESIEKMQKSAENTAQTVHEMHDMFNIIRLTAAVSKWKTATLILLIPYIAFFIYVIIG